MTIVLIDKHPVSSKGLTLFLKEHFKKVILITADNAAIYTALPTDKKPDLIILSISQNWNRDNLTSIKLLKKRLPLVPFIAYDSEPDHTKYPCYLQAGVNGYLSKQSSVEELLECITAVMEEKQYICSEVIKSVINGDYNNGNSQFSTNMSTLSPREYEITKYLIQGMKISIIAETMERDISTISNAKTNIFKKLEVESILQLRDLMQHNTQK